MHTFLVTIDEDRQACPTATQSMLLAINSQLLPSKQALK